MNPTYYYILHVFFGFLLVAWNFQAFAAPDPARRKRMLMLTGIASLVVLVAGFGLLSKLSLGFPGWVIVKLVCWLILSAQAGMAFRKPGSVGAMQLVCTVVVLVALVMVYLKPF